MSDDIWTHGPIDPENRIFFHSGWNHFGPKPRSWWRRLLRRPAKYGQVTIAAPPAGSALLLSGEFNGQLKSWTRGPGETEWTER